MINRRSFITSCVALLVVPHLSAVDCVDPESTLYHLLREWELNYGYVPSRGTVERSFLEAFAAHMDGLMRLAIYGDPDAQLPVGVFRQVC